LILLSVILVFGCRWILGTCPFLFSEPIVSVKTV
jgi:hypothetical protein